MAINITQFSSPWHLLIPSLYRHLPGFVRGWEGLCLYGCNRNTKSEVSAATAGSVRLGQEIVAFDEDPNFGDNRRVARHYRTATVETNALKLMSCSRVSTDIGDPIVASHDHPWLVWAKNRSRERIFFHGHAGRNTPRTAGLEWKSTSAVNDQPVVSMRSEERRVGKEC